MVKGQWAAWQLLEGWKAADQDIGWAETVTMELALLWMVSEGIHNVKVVIHGDNTGVLGALKKGRSWNTACNLYLADACSRSELGTDRMCLPVLFVLPSALTHFIHNV